MPLIHLCWNSPNPQNDQYHLDETNSGLSKSLKIGRDGQICRICIDHGTVSRIHAEIIFKQKWERFYLRNLEPKNPVRVDGGRLVRGEVALYQGSVIQLGQVLVHVDKICLDDAETSADQLSPQVLNSALLPTSNLVPQSPLNKVYPTSSNTRASGAIAPTNPKLICPKCHTLQPISQRNSACTVCGHFLADAASKLLD